MRAWNNRGGIIGDLFVNISFTPPAHNVTNPTTRRAMVCLDDPATGVRKFTIATKRRKIVLTALLTLVETQQYKDNANDDQE